MRGSDHIRKGAEQFRLDIYLLGTGWKVVCYEQSAFYLSQMMLGVSLGCYVMEDTLWLAKAEVDVSRISHENIISYSKTEYVLHYTPHNGFHEWLAEIK